MRIKFTDDAEMDLHDIKKYLKKKAGDSVSSKESHTRRELSFMAQVNIRIDDNLKERADKLFDELGLNMTTAFNIFVKTAVRQRGIPFDLTLDPFYSESNQAELSRRIAEIESGSANFVTHELIEVEDV